MNTVHLIGSEEVGRAGHNISSAAQEMMRAASNIETSCEQLRIALDQHTYMLSCVMERKDDAPTLRDYFAAKALPAIMDGSWPDFEFTPQSGLTPIENCAAFAYEAADAMLKARAA